MKYFPILFAVTFILILLIIVFHTENENMITSNNIARMSRGYNVMNTGGSYDDAMNQLNSAEKMTLASVETGM